MMIKYIALTKIEEPQGILCVMKLPGSILSRNCWVCGIKTRCNCGPFLMHPASWKGRKPLSNVLQEHPLGVQDRAAGTGSVGPLNLWTSLLWLQVTRDAISGLLCPFLNFWIYPVHPANLPGRRRIAVSFISASQMHFEGPVASG